MAEKEPSYEAPVWARVQGEWRSLYGNFDRDGVSLEWHDFECEHTLEWSRSFHQESLEICVNLEGCGTIREKSAPTTVINPQTVVHYTVEPDHLRAERHAAQRHRFLTVEMSRDWLARTTGGHKKALNRETRDFLDGVNRTGRTREHPLSSRVKRTAEELLKPPIQGIGLGFWFHAKILEIMAHTLTEPDGDLFCQRHKRLAQERIEQVKQILLADLEHPPTLPELGREVGCSPFYLSRVFSEHTGMTISRYLRTMRLERAAELLRSGECNVTEAAMTVGYSSLSHFSKAFAEMFGECPCVFPLKKTK